MTSLILYGFIRPLNLSVFTTMFLACTHSALTLATGHSLTLMWIQQEAEPCDGSRTVKHNSTYYSSIIDLSFLFHAQYQASSV